MDTSQISMMTTMVDMNNNSTPFPQIQLSCNGSCESKWETEKK